MDREFDTEELEDEDTIVSGSSVLDSKTSQLNDVLTRKLEQAFESHTPQLLLSNISKIARDYDPIDLAHAVTRLPPQERVVVYENLPDLPAKIIFIINTGTTTRTTIFRRISDYDIRDLISQMPLDEAVWILEDMSDRRLRRVLDLLEPKKRARIIDLQKHDRNSAGRLMTNEFFAFHMNTTIDEVATQIRDNPGIALTRYIFVLSNTGELIGYVPSRALIINSHHLPLRHVMKPLLHTVTADVSRDEVVDIVERYKIEALPVIDDEMRLVGIITYEDVVEAMEDIADNTIASIAGTAEEVGDSERTIKRFLLRAPWLLVTLCAGLFTATMMAHFTNRVWFTMVPLFIPLITGMSGNVGIQCSTILVRWMSMGEMSYGSRRAAIIKEMMIGMMIGVMFGFLCGAVIWTGSYLGVYKYFDLHELEAGINSVVMMVSCGVFGACLTATTLGSLSPFFFDRMGVDPAVASGPIVTAFNDVLSTLMFFLVARLIYTVV